MEERGKRGLKFVDRDMIKYIAIFVMFWGHLFAWVTLIRHPEVSTPYEIMPFWQQLIAHASLLCPPIMFFFIADGYKYTRNRKKYALRLLIFACITQVFDWFVFVPTNGWWSTNVIFTLLFGLLAIFAWESEKKKWLRVLLVILCCGATLLIVSEWFSVGVLFILFLHIYRDEPKKRLIAFTVIAFSWKLVGAVSQLVTGTPALTVAIDSLLDLVFVMAGYPCMTVFYNGKKGRHPVFAKWFFYAFYPLHYLLIWCIAKFAELLPI